MMDDDPTGRRCDCIFLCSYFTSLPATAGRFCSDQKLCGLRDAASRRTQIEKYLSYGEDDTATSYFHFPFLSKIYIALETLETDRSPPFPSFET